jgi:hypothetical protein
MILMFIIHTLQALSQASAFDIATLQPIFKVITNNHTYICENVSSSKTFLCNSEHETTKSILVFNGFVKESMIFDKKSGAFTNLKDIKYFKENNEEIMSFDGQTTQTLTDLLNTQAKLLKNIFYKKDERNNEIEILGTPKFEEIKKAGIKKVKEFQAQLDSILDNLELRIDNEKLTCNRLKSKSSTQCDIFQCSGNQNTNVLVGFYQTVQGTYSSSLVYMKNNEIFNVPTGNIYLGDAKNNEVIKSYRNENGEPLPGSNGSKLYPASFNNKNQAALFVLNPAAVGLFNSMLNNCSEEIEKTFHKAQQDLRDEINEFELKEYITFLGNQAYSSFISPENLTSITCDSNGKLYSQEAFQNISEIQNFYQSSFQSKNAITPEKAYHLFEMALKNEKIYWANTSDGCYARAEIMKKQFLEQDVYVDKAWIAGDLTDGVFNKGKSWDYHVAPLVYVKDKNDQIQKMVIDPALFDKPVTLEEWIAKTTKKSKYKNIETVFPMPANNFYAGKNTYTITNSNIYAIKDSANITGEKAYLNALQVMEGMKSNIYGN